MQYVRADGTLDKIRLATDALPSTDTTSGQGSFNPVTDPRPFKIVTVTVQGPVGPTIQISTLRYKQGLREQLPLVQTRTIQKIQIEAQGAASGLSGRNSVNLLNRFPGTGDR